MDKTGTWIIPTIIGGKAYRIPHCSSCGTIPCGVDENTRYCPNCGSFNGKVEKENKEVNENG